VPGITTSGWVSRVVIQTEGCPRPRKQTSATIARSIVSRSNTVAVRAPNRHHRPSLVVRAVTTTAAATQIAAKPCGDAASHAIHTRVLNNAGVI
jgi:hypothetical protein